MKSETARVIIDWRKDFRTRCAQTQKRAEHPSRRWTFWECNKVLVIKKKAGAAVEEFIYPVCAASPHSHVLSTRGVLFSPR
jgi:hypothetical protein